MSKKIAIASSYGVTWNADKIRTLRWNRKALRTFEDEVRPLLGVARSDTVNARAILGGPHGNRTDVLSLAVQCALLHEESLDEDQVYALIDAYNERGGSDMELRDKLFEACLIATDPSSVVSWRKNSESLRNLAKREEEIAKIEREAEDLKAKARMAQAKKALADAEEMISGERPASVSKSVSPPSTT